MINENTKLNCGVQCEKNRLRKQIKRKGKFDEEMAITEISGNTEIKTRFLFPFLVMVSE